MHVGCKMPSVEFEFIDLDINERSQFITEIGNSKSVLCLPSDHKTVLSNFTKHNLLYSWSTPMTAGKGVISQYQVNSYYMFHFILFTDGPGCAQPKMLTVS